MNIEEDKQKDKDMPFNKQTKEEHPKLVMDKEKEETRLFHPVAREKVRNGLADVRLSLSFVFDEDKSEFINKRLNHKIDTIRVTKTKIKGMKKKRPFEDPKRLEMKNNFSIQINHVSQPESENEPIAVCNVFLPKIKTKSSPYILQNAYSFIKKIRKPRTVKVTSPQPYFEYLFDILSKIFKNQYFKVEPECFNDITFFLFCAICKRKFRYQITDKHSDTQIDGLKQLIENSTVDKRPEECKKLIFSLAIKHMKKKLKQNPMFKNINKWQFEEKFYEFYFGDISEQEGIPLINFYFPISKNRKKKTIYKTLNKPYIDIVKKSDKFIIEFLEYIERQAIIDYSKEIDNKLYEVLIKWNFNYQDNVSSAAVILDIERYFKSHKSKLPWTVNDIKYAIGKVKEVIY